MAIDFFEKELVKVQERFNQTFGETQAVNLLTRSHVILSIIYLGLIAKEINKQGIKKNGEKDIEKVKEFMKIKAILNKVFDRFETEIEIQNQKGKEALDYERHGKRIAG